MCPKKVVTKSLKTHAAVEVLLHQLTFDDLRVWAGDTIFNRGQRYLKKVSGLSLTPEGALAGWVSGSERYATSVHVKSKKHFDHTCTCPYDWGGPCKHTVALVLAAGTALKEKRTIYSLPEDSLAHALAGKEDDDWDVDIDGEEDEAPAPSRKRAGKERLKELLAGKSREALLQLLINIAGQDPAVARQIHEAEQLANGKTEKLVQALRKEILRLSTERAWYNPWRNEGHRPDYEPIVRRLQELHQAGHADAVVALGEEIWTRGNAQVEQSNDEGETAAAIANCLKVVLAALPDSSLPPTAQLLWVVERLQADEFALLDASADNLLRNRAHTRAHTRAHWRDVAEMLEKRFDAMPKPKGIDFFRTLPPRAATPWRDRCLHAGGVAGAHHPPTRSRGRVLRLLRKIRGRPARRGRTGTGTPVVPRRLYAHGKRGARNCRPVTTTAAGDRAEIPSSRSRSRLPCSGFLPPPLTEKPMTSCAK